MSETNAQKVQEVIIAGMSKTVANYDYAMSELEALVAANNMHAALRLNIKLLFMLQLIINI